MEQYEAIAVLIDAENISPQKLRPVLDEISKYGRIIARRAYGDWTGESLKHWKDPLNALSIKPEQQFAYTKGKNSSDIAMVIDAMDLLYTKKFDAFVIVSSDSDFTGLVSRLKEDGMYVFGVGKKTTPSAFKNTCDNFISIENLDEEQAESTEKKQKKTEITDAKELIKPLTRAWEDHQNDDGWVNVSDAGQLIKRLRPDFDPRTYGARNLTDVINKLGDHFETTNIKFKGHGVTMYKPKLK